MKLIEFLLARIAEDEAVARLTPEEAAGWEAPFSRPLQWTVTASGSPDGLVVDPARVLAECASKRALVGLHRAGDDEFPTCTMCNANGPEAQGWPCQTLMTLSLPYADHPDYDPAWALDG